MITIPNFLLDSEIEEMNELFSRAEWEDGKNTARGAAKDVKSNRQIIRSWNGVGSLDLIMSNAIRRCITLRREVSPKAYTPPLYSEYKVGDEYGDHVDASAAGSPQIRLDLSMTVWLSPPGSYDGGTLWLPDNEVKGDAGSATVYPTTYIHRVTPVDRGVRRVAVCWFQSQYRDPEIRQLISDARAVRDNLKCSEHAGAGCGCVGGEDVTLATKLLTNLERKFME